MNTLNHLSKKYRAVHSPPGRRVRTAIQSGYDQLKALAQDRYPTVLVLLDNVGIADHTDPYAIKTGMFGLETIDIAVPRNFERSPYAIGRRFGKKRRVSPSERRSLSAVAVMIRKQEGIDMHIFHNPFANIPLSHHLLTGPRFLHFRLAKKEPGKFQDWEMLPNKGFIDRLISIFWRY